MDVRLRSWDDKLRPYKGSPPRKHGGNDGKCSYVCVTYQISAHRMSDSEYPKTAAINVADRPHVYKFYILIVISRRIYSKISHLFSLLDYRFGRFVLKRNAENAAGYSGLRVVQQQFAEPKESTRTWPSVYYQCWKLSYYGIRD